MGKSENHPVFSTGVGLKFDAEAFGCDYDVFRIDAGKRRIPGGARVLDIPEEHPFVLSSVFDAEGLYVLCRKSACAEGVLARAVSEGDEEGVLRCSRSLPPEEIPEAAVAKLLLGASVNGRRASTTFQNVSGRLLRYYGREKDGPGVVAVEIRLSGDDGALVLSAAVRTFVPLSFRDSMRRWDKKKKRFVAIDDGYIERIGRFAIDAEKGVLRRVLPSERIADDDVYIQKKPRWASGSRNTVAFLDRSSAEKFEATKAGILLEVVDGFNRRYGGAGKPFLAEMTFSRMDDVCVWSRDAEGDVSSASAQTAYAHAVAAFLERTPLRVVDAVGDERSSAAAKRLCKAFSELLEKRKIPFCGSAPAVATAGDIEPAPGFFDVRIVPDLESLEDKDDDPYIRNEILAQHVAVSSLRKGKSLSAIAEKILAESVVKADIAQNRITAFDWGSLGLSEDAVFVAPDWTGDDAGMPAALVVHPSGEFDYIPAKKAPFEFGLVAGLCGWLGEEKTERGAWKAEAMVGMEGAIGVISDSGMSALPDIEHLREKLDGAKDRGVSAAQVDFAFECAKKEMNPADSAILDSVFADLFANGRTAATTAMVKRKVSEKFPKTAAKAEGGEAVESPRPSSSKKALKRVDEAFREAFGFGVNAYTAGGEFGKYGPVYAGIRGVWSCERADGYLFCAGEIVEGDSAETSYATAPRIRKLQVVEGDGKRLIELVARMLDVRFVRLNRTTVLPFPFKYLRECSAAMRSCEDSGEEGKKEG